MTDLISDLALLHHHGDRDQVPGAVDLAVNVRAGGTPDWLRAEIAATDLAAYPDQSDAIAAVAHRHCRDRSEVLLTSGAAEAFVLIARALAPRRTLVIHPQFTEPEVALRAAGHPVDRLVLEWPFTLDPTEVAEDADLVVIGNPTNPTSVAHSRQTLRALVRPGRIVVIDEAFADCVVGEPDSLAADPDLSGVIVVRSLTKTWGLAGLRVGYLLADPATVQRLRAVQPAWPVSSPALTACVACARPDALAEARVWADSIASTRTDLMTRLSSIDAVHPVPSPAGSFILARTDRPDVRERLLTVGFAVRRGDTFPGLGPEWFRAAVRDETASASFTAGLRGVLTR